MDHETLARHALEALAGGCPAALLDAMDEHTSWLFPDSDPRIAPLTDKNMIEDYLRASAFGTSDGPTFSISHVEDMDNFVVAEVVQHFRPSSRAHCTEYWTYALEFDGRRLMQIRAYKEPDD